MKHNIHILPSDIEFQATEDSSILESALKVDIHLAYSCNNGSCGACKAKIIKGSVTQDKNLEGLSQKDVQNGYILTCSAKPQSSLEIEATYYPELDGIKPMVLPCKVDNIDFPVSDVTILKLRLPPNNQLNYLPGQYIDLVYQDLSRSYSIANAPTENNTIELHIREVDGGVFSRLVFDELKKNQLLQLKGPLGTFFIRESKAPVIFVAGGTGFAPVKAMIEYLLTEKSQRPIYLYWGSQTIEGFYSQSPKQWQNEHSNIQFVPVLSGENPNWTGRRGYVHQLVLEDFNHLSAFEVYACGSSVMIDATKQDFIANGLKPEHFFSDAFVASK